MNTRRSHEVNRIPGTHKALRLRPLRRLPVTFGWMSKRPLPDELVDRWPRPAQRPRAVRRDLRAYLVGARRGHMVAVCEQLAGFGRPTLWYGRRGRVQRPQHGCRLVTVLPTLGWPRSPTATC